MKLSKIIFERQECSMNEKMILVVDDEPEICNELSGFLTSKGFKVITANDGKEGVILFQQHKPILVLSDYKMPNMNGIELLKRIKMINKDIHVVLISGAADGKIIVEAMKEDAFDFISKPIDLKDLMEVISTAISKTLSKVAEGKTRHSKSDLVHDVTTIGDAITVLYLSEDMDEYSVNKYDTYIKNMLSESSVKKNLVLFLKSVKYINSMGLNYLISLNDFLKQKGFQLFLCALSQPVDFYLRSLGYLDYFKIESSVDSIAERVIMHKNETGPEGKVKK
jgi:anti-anti-sigma factor